MKVIPFEMLPSFVEPNELLKTIQVVSALPESAEKLGMLRVLSEALNYAMHPPMMTGETFLTKQGRYVD